MKIKRINQILLLGLLLFSIALSELAVDTKCDLLMRYVNGYGISMYAGKDFSSGMETLQNCVGIPIPLSVIYRTELVNYIEGYNATHGLMTLGHGMLYNHLPSSENVMIRKFPSIDSYDSSSSTTTTTTTATGQIQFYPPYSHEYSYDVLFETNGYIRQGEQIFSHYGDSWFIDRDLQEMATKHDKNSEIENVYYHSNIHQAEGILPGCSSQLLTLNNNRLLANQDIRQGQIIEVVRALLLPEMLVSDFGPLSAFLWWKPRFRHADDHNNSTSNADCRSLDDDNITTAIDTLSYEYILNNKTMLTYTKDRYRHKNTSAYHVDYDVNENYVLLLSGYGLLYGTTSTIATTTTTTTTAIPSDNIQDNNNNNNDDDDDDDEINVEYDWWDIDSTEKSKSTFNCSNNQNHSYTPTHLNNITTDIEYNSTTNDTILHNNNNNNNNPSRYTENGYKCTTQMYVSFTAKFNISKGSPLITDLRRDTNYYIKYMTKSNFWKFCL